MSLSVTFKFNKAGQGLFYTGILKAGNKHFTFVYDCGSDSNKSYILEEIRDFKNILINKTLNLLIVSHFHRDHINRISDLLKDIDCNRVMMPYLEPAERLYLYLTTQNKDSEYINFLLDPVKFFEDKNVQQIILLGPSENNESNIVPDFEPINPEYVINGNFDGDIDKCLQESDKLKQKFLVNENISSISIDKLLFFNSKGKIILLKCWEFIFFQRKYQNINFSVVQSELKEIIDRNGIYSIFNFKKRSLINNIYNNYFSNSNLTSLVIYHGIMDNLETLLKSKILYFLTQQTILYSNILHSGTLLTGDIDINTEKKHDEIINYFNQYLKNISIFQIPHHGSDDNWFVSTINNLNISEFYIINFGFGNIHYHPSEDVLNDILINFDKILLFNTQFSTILYIFNS
jgi:hypothetical protein